MTGQAVAALLGQDDAAADELQRQELIYLRDEVCLTDVTLESRYATPALPEAGAMASETFVFKVSFKDVRKHAAYFTIIISEEFARAAAFLAEDAPVNMLSTAWAELASLSDSLCVAAGARGAAAERDAEAHLLAR